MLFKVNLILDQRHDSETAQAWRSPRSLPGHLIHRCLLGSRTGFYSKSSLPCCLEQGVPNGWAIMQLNSSPRRFLMFTWTCPWGLSGDLSIGSHLSYYSSLHSNLKIYPRERISDSPDYTKRKKPLQFLSSDALSSYGLKQQDPLNMKLSRFFLPFPYVCCSGQFSRELTWKMWMGGFFSLKVIFATDNADKCDLLPSGQI